MIGSVALAGFARSSRQTSVPSTPGRLRSRISRSGRRRGDGGQGRRPRGHRLDLDVPAAFEGVFDEIGDVGFVLDDQDSRQFSRHQSHDRG